MRRYLFALWMMPNVEQAQIRLSEIIAPTFRSIHREARSSSSLTKFWLKGGRGSTKSSFIAIEIILGIIEDPDANAVVVRKVGDTIRRSVMTTLLWAIDTLKVPHLFRCTVSPAEIIYIPTGQKIIMLGLDDPQKLKSLKAKKGYFKILWFEEVAEFNGMAEIRSVRQSVLRGGSASIEYASYNPPNDPQAWVNREVEVSAPNRLVHHSTYLDVPPEWLGDEFIAEARYLQEHMPLIYDHEYMGEAVGNHEAVIFADKYAVRDFEPQPNWDGPYYGADWGFANDPNTLVKCWLEEVEQGRFKLYIEYAAFGYGTELDDLPAFYDDVPDSRTHVIRADCARPETISHMKRRGFRIEAAPKWQGSVEDGITVIKSFTEIVIHTRCTEMQQEARLYSYKIDRHTQDVLPVIVDKYNHGWDAVRYALAKFIKPRKKGRFAI